MCDASDLAMGAVFGQREDGKPYVIYYASKTLNEAQRNYTTTEKELLAVVFALDKFRAYLVGSSIVVFTDHSALKYLLTKQDAKARLIRWILLLQEFNLQIRDKKGVENVVADHLSRLVIAHDSHGLPINDDFPEESLMSIDVAPWYSHITNYLVTREVPSEWSAQDKRHFFAKIHAYYWEEPFLFKYCADQIIRKCVPEQEQSGILSHCHDSACGGHFASQKTAMKVIQSGFWWPSLFKDAHSMCKGCDRCQRLGKLTRRNMMPLNPILIVDVFDVWGIDFMGPFPMSFGHSYILVGVDYVSKWVEAIPCRSNDHRVVLKFLKDNIFARFGVPKAIISDGGTHFCNKPFETLLAKYGVKHKVGRLEGLKNEVLVKTRENRGEKTRLSKICTPPCGESEPCANPVRIRFLRQFSKPCSLSWRITGAPAGHESAETPIGHESNGAVAGESNPESNGVVATATARDESNGAVAGESNPESNGVVATATARDESNGVVAGDVVHAILNTIAEEAMNFMSYVAEVSRGWDEPNARDMRRMKSQPKAKGEMYILNDGMDMKAEIAAMERRLEELEMTNMQPVQAISQTSLQAMPCAICRSYEHLLDECPTIPAEREMFGDCNTYNSNWRDHPNFSWKPQPPQYKQHVQALPQASILEQAMVNLSKFVGDFVGKQEAINAQLNQRIDSVESSLIKRMDEVQNDLSQKFDILQDSISRFLDDQNQEELKRN
uniref:Integrase catalytic domain-containing protein n=1 Tax=Vitis vinifera TaxID=29760 RepID=A5CA60_VITVI|nr:hypothetical protein VITISV_021139 [Vitis vinifera]